jgi:hypothetical protein
VKKTALLAAAAALMTAAPAVAATGGYLGVEYGQADAEFIGDLEVESLQGEGAFGWHGGSWGAQVNGSFGNLSFDSSADDADSMALNGHLYFDGGGWRLGGVIAHTSLDFGSGGGSIDETVYGVEGMFDLSPNTNIFASFTTGEAEFLVDADTWNLDAGVNFYATPNIRIGGFLGTGNLDFGSGDGDVFSAGIDGEFQPWSFPISLTAAWRHFDVEDGGLEADAFQVGARWNFGGGTIQDRNNVTPFNTYGPLLDRLYGVY